VRFYKNSASDFLLARLNVWTICSVWLPSRHEMRLVVFERPNDGAHDKKGDLLLGDVRLFVRLPSRQEMLLVVFEQSNDGAHGKKGDILLGDVRLFFTQEHTAFASHLML